MSEFDNPIDDDGGGTFGTDFRAAVRRGTAIDYRALDMSPDFPLHVLEGNELPAGHAILFDRDYRPIDVANRFLRDHCLLRRPRTQQAYADDLAQWWRYLASVGKEWHEAKIKDIKNYASTLGRRVSLRTRRTHSRSTLSRRVGTVELLYRWAFAEGLIDRPVVLFLPEANGSPTPTDAGIRKRRGGRLVQIARVEQEQHIRPFTVEEMRDLLATLGPDPLDPVRPLHLSVRNRLVAELALATGMRIEEVCALTTHQIEDLGCFMDPCDPDTGVDLELTETKGGKKRRVLIRYPEWKAATDYISGERKAVLDKVKEAAAAEKKSFRPTSNLFVNGLEANRRDRGRPLRPDTISRVFRKALFACDQTRTVMITKVDPATGRAAIDPATQRIIREPRTVPRHSFHDLRHTFACWLYGSEVAAKRAPPLLKLQRLLGHRHLSTTTDIYLKHFDVNEVDVSNAFSRLLRNLHDADAR